MAQDMLSNIQLTILNQACKQSSYLRIQWDKRVCGLFVLQVWFINLDVAIHVAFFVLEEDVPTFLPMKHISDNGLDISI